MISGLTIVRNGVKLGYPFVASIRSVLPLCGEFIIGVGDSDDGTRRMVEEIGDPRIKIIDTVWDMSKRTGGTILSEQTNLALARCTGDWVCYIQADEVALEKDHDRVRAAVERLRGRDDVDGIAFDYVHFYGSYFTVQRGRNWYGREVRLIRNGRGIVSHGDAQGFRRNGGKLRAVEPGVRMYHYGWARPPDVMAEKIKSFHRFWHDDEWIAKNCAGSDAKRFFSDLGNLVPFDGEHPAVMKDVVNRDSEPFIQGCREAYLKNRKLGDVLRDLSRRLPMGRHRNYAPVR